MGMKLLLLLRSVPGSPSDIDQGITVVPEIGRATQAITLVPVPNYFDYEDPSKREMEFRLTANDGVNTDFILLKIKLVVSRSVLHIKFAYLHSCIGATPKVLRQRFSRHVKVCTFVRAHTESYEHCHLRPGVTSLCRTEIDTPA